MALVCIGCEKGNMDLPIYKDTDDLADLEYHYYRKAERLGRNGTARRILVGSLSGQKIESDSDYEWLKDKEEG